MPAPSRSQVVEESQKQRGVGAEDTGSSMRVIGRWGVMRHVREL